MDTFEEGIKNTYGDELLNNAKANIVEAENEVWEYGQPENMFMAMEDSDSSFEEDQIAEIARRINLEMLRNECSEELEELRRNESQPQSQEQNIAVENPTLEVDNIERMPYRESEWFALMDHNRERESLGLEPIYPWENHLELATGV